MSDKEAKSLFYQANTELLRQIKEKEVFRIEDEDFPVIEPVSFEVAMSKPESCQDFVCFYPSVWTTRTIRRLRHLR